MSDKNKHIEVINNTKLKKKIERDIEEMCAKLRELFTPCSVDVGGDYFLEVFRWFSKFATIKPSYEYDTIHESHGERRDIEIVTKEEYFPKVKEFALWYCETAKQKHVPKVRIVI